MTDKNPLTIASQPSMLSYCLNIWIMGYDPLNSQTSKGIARTQSPTNKNYALELPTFGVIVGVSQTGVQWKGLTLGELPS